MNMNKTKRGETKDDNTENMKRNNVPPMLPNSVLKMPGYYGQINLYNLAWHLEFVSGKDPSFQKKLLKKVS